MNQTRFKKILLSLLAILLLGINSYSLAAQGDDPSNLSAGERSINLAGSPARVVLVGDDAYRVSLDGQNFSRLLPQRTQIKLRYRTFDPLAEGTTLSVPEKLAAQETNAYIVQFVTQSLLAYRKEIASLGGRVFTPIPEQANIVLMDAKARERVAKLPYVRWIGLYQPAYKLEQELIGLLTAGARDQEARYSIMVLEKGPAMQKVVADRIAALGGEVVLTLPQSFRLEAVLNNAQLLAVAQMDEILFIDRWTPPEEDMNNAREISGANYIESLQGYSGEGVRGEVMDGGLRTTHQDFRARPPIMHTSNTSSQSHGTSTYGQVFGDGAGSSTARGLLPDGQGIFAAYDNVSNRYAHTQALVNSGGSYRAVFQTNSWGNTQTTNYTSISAEMDDIIFDLDILIMQSQSNTGDRNSRPQAWAKNILSVGGIRHYDTLSRSDDAWNGGASIGPASDGRIKPDLAHFYDSIRTTSSSSDTSYTNSFGGTSGATPITAGYAGLLFQMWADGVFAGGPGQGRDVFNSRPHAATAKALLINSAYQYSFSGTSHDLTRVHQGWGMVDLQNLYDIAELNGWSLPVLINESAVIAPLQTHTYNVNVTSGTPLKVTLAYADPAGSPSASVHRINDLNLRVTSPGGTVYWGNNGLLSGNWSTSGGSSNDVDTVENVFIQNPASGSWTIQVLADEIVQDGHVETGALDADYALVVTARGSSGPTPTPPPATNTPQPPTPTPPPGDEVFFDNFETNKGWTVNPGGSDTATTGQWERANPQGTSYSGTDYQLDTTVSGSNDLVTGGAAGSSAGSYDIDGGVTTIRSPNITLPTGDVTLSFSYYLAHYSNSSADDYLRVKVVGSTTQTVFEELGAANVDGASWATFSTNLNAFAGQTIYLRIEAADAGSGSLIEAAVDDVRITGTGGPSPTNTPPPPTNTPPPPPTNTPPPPPTNTPPPPPTNTPPPGGAIFSDNFETNKGWTVNPSGTDSATTGQWERANPQGTTYSGTDYQLDNTASGSYDLVTGPLAGSSVGSYDIDGGLTTIRSPNISLPAGGGITLSFNYYLAHYSNASSDDFLRVKVVGATTSTVFEELGAANIDGAAWASFSTSLDAYAGQTIYLLIEAADGGGGSLVEAAVDDVLIEQ